jgi:hypothetical protein
MLARVRQCLDQYQEKYRRAGLPELELRGLYALFPDDDPYDAVESRWNDEYPNADRKGVYLIFGRTGTLLYVGKASLGSSIGGRLGTHFAGTKQCRLLSADWTERPAYVATIAVPPDMSFEAPALEEYLIRSLSPRDNRLGLADQASASAREDAAPSPAPKPADETGSAAPPGPGVYTYSAPGMPMCSRCEERPAIFYCTTHQSGVCLECVARHDDAAQCVYLPEFRAPSPATPPPAASPSSPPVNAPKPPSVLGL